MNKKIGLIPLFAILAAFLTAATASANKADATANLTANSTAIIRDYRQSDDGFDDEDSFVDEDGVTWYLHEDGWYYDVPPGEFTGWEDDSEYQDDYWDSGEFDDGFWDDEDTDFGDPFDEYDDFGEFEDDEDYDLFEDMSEEEIAEREASTTGKVPADPGEHPSTVALVSREESNAYNGQFCGGSLIAPQWILTAAHCVEGTNASEVDIVIGRDVLSSNAGERIPAAKIISHDDYTSGRDDNADIALIKLSRPAKEGEIIAIANNTTTGHLDDAGVDVTVSGWGILQEFANDSPDTMHDVTTEIVSNETCKIGYGDESINNSVLCAGEKEGGKDSCSGDSGGPLVAQENGSPVQVGVVSWGDGCGLAGSYGVYTRVATFQNWLAEHMNS